jgi:hypothetical protein
MKVVNYFSSIPARNKNFEKEQMLKCFSEGVKRHQRDVVDHRGKYVPCDVAVIQGWVHEDSGNTPHLMLRKDVIQQQALKKKHVITADSNLFLYAVGKINEPHHYLRYSINGIFPNTGIYCDTNIDPRRWQQLSQDHNISLKDYRSNGNHILVCLQRNGGWSMGKLDVMEWVFDVLKQIRTVSDRPIVVRAHPGDKDAANYLKIFDVGVTISTNNNLLDDLKNCWAVVNHNSSPAVAAAIEGYPVFVTDIEKSQCREIANLDLATIETPVLFNRQAWVERLSMFHWKFTELRSGACWQHMKQYL